MYQKNTDFEAEVTWNIKSDSLGQLSFLPLNKLYNQTLFDMFILTDCSPGCSSWLLTRLPPTGSAVLLADSPAPHIWREKMSGIPSCCTKELKKGSTEESGWLRDRRCIFNCIFNSLKLSWALGFELLVCFIIHSRVSSFSLFSLYYNQ